MKKWLVVVCLILGVVILWRRYGYLVGSVRNFHRPNQTLEETRLATTAVSDSELSYLIVEPGYQVSVYAKELPGARSMARGKNGVVYVGTRGEGVVYALSPDSDGQVQDKVVVARGLDTPNGVAYLDGVLYVAELSRIIAFDDIDDNYKDNPSFRVVYDKLPSEQAHGWKYLAVGPDNMLYVTVGVPCNICKKQAGYGEILRIDPNNSSERPQTIASGIRNSVGMDWDPSNDSLWFTDNGRDWLGDDSPQDELNHLRVEGQDFGFPYCHSGDILDPVYGRGKRCQDYEPPVVKLGAHVAALGMKFVSGRIVIAEHGSWNRKEPVGYRVVQVDPVTLSTKVLVGGWLGTDGVAKGRPVDILPYPDGSFLVSDDLGGIIYRVFPTQ